MGNGLETKREKKRKMMKLLLRKRRPRIPKVKMWYRLSSLEEGRCVVLKYSPIFDF